MWALYAGLAGVSWGIANLFDKYVMNKRIQNTLLFIFMGAALNIFIGSTLLLIGDIQGIIDYWPQMFLMALIDIIALFSYVYALKLDDVSRVIPLFIMAMIFVPVGDAIFLGNVLSYDKYIGIALIALFGFLLLLDPAKGITHSLKVFILMSLSSLGFSSIWLIGETVVDDVGAVTFSGFLYLLRFLAAPAIAIGACIHMRSSIAKVYGHVRESFRLTTFLLILCANTLGVSGMFLFMYALQGEGIPSLVDAMAMSQYIFVFLAPLILTKFWPHHFHEHVTKKIFLQKFVCISAMIIGGVMLLL